MVCYAGLLSAAPLDRLLYTSASFSRALAGVVNGEVAWWTSGGAVVVVVVFAGCLWSAVGVRRRGWAAVTAVACGAVGACVPGVACAGRSQFGLRYKDWCVLTPTFPHDFVESWWLEGPGGVSVALGLFPTKGGSFGVVLVGPVGCLRGRWRSRLWKWRNGAVSRGRGQEAPRTFRCIKTAQTDVTWAIDGSSGLRVCCLGRAGRVLACSSAGTPAGGACRCRTSRKSVRIRDKRASGTCT